MERYRYARFMYECLFDVTENGGTCYDPLLFHFPDVPGAYDDLEHTFIVGNALKISPVLQPMANMTNGTFTSFFPKGNWVDMDTFEVINVTNILGANITLDSQVTVKKHLRPGWIIPVQYNETCPVNSTNKTTDNANSTADLIYTGINLFVNRDQNGFAQGKLFLDQGMNISELDTTVYEYYQFRLANQTLQKLKINQDRLVSGAQGVREIKITNAADLSTIDQACYISTSWDFQNMSVPEYDEKTQTLTLMALDGDINVAQMQMIHFTAPGDPYSLCDSHSAGWHINTTSYNESDLNSSNINFQLISNKNPNRSMSVNL